MDKLVVALLLTNIFLFCVFVITLVDSYRKMRELRNLSHHYAERYEALIEWLGKNLGKYGRFEKEKGTNIIHFRPNAR